MKIPLPPPIGSLVRRLVSPLAPPEDRAAPRLAVLIGVVFAGFIAIISLNPLLSVLLKDIDLRISNGQARLFVTEELMRGIKDIEIETFRLATTMGVPAQDRIAARLQQRIAKLERDLLVLRDGGSVRQSLPVTVDGADQLVREETYRPEPGQSYVVEVIELAPQLDEMHERLAELRTRIGLRDQLRDQPDRDAFVAAEKAVKGYLKHLPTFFFRLHETVSRHVVETSARVRHLEAERDERYRLHHHAETVLIVLVIALVMTIGIIFTRQIHSSTARLHAAHDAMRSAKEEAEAASRAKSEFVSRMSHELRTPLNAILGFAQLLKGQNPDPSHSVYLEEIDKAGAHLLQLINQVLDLAKMEAGRLELEAIEFDPVRLLDEVTAVVAQRAGEKGLQVRAAVSPGLPARVVGDPTRLRQVLINLLGNAIKFTGSGEIGLSAQALGDGDRILFRVWDTGPGIEQAVLRKLFHAFVQADNSTMRRFGGSGLGLMISKEFVAAMGGSIEVESEVGRGSCFSFVIPLRAPPGCAPRPKPLADAVCIVASADPALAAALACLVESLGGKPVVYGSAQAASQAARAPEPPRLVVADLACRGALEAPALRTAPVRLLIAPGSGAAATCPGATAILHPPVTYTQLCDALAACASQPSREAAATAACNRLASCGAKILLVEDNPVNQLVAGAMLEKLGIGYDWAGDGVDALEKLAREHFDLVLMDMEMPRLDGIDTTRELRRREAAAGRPRLPVIAMTANALAQDRARCLEAGMDDHLGKPVRIEELGETLERWLGAASDVPEVPSPRQQEAALLPC
jgi:signal transduction histidine kinase/CheY-like chemotaxis protein